jgi:hypothetical protein
MLNKHDYDPEWIALQDKLKDSIGKKPTLNAIIFLIGVQELGKGLSAFSKEEKQDLMHVGICHLLSQSGYYEFEGRDEQGWPHYRLVKTLPLFDLIEQEKLLMMHIKEYFKDL